MTDSRLLVTFCNQPVISQYSFAAISPESDFVSWLYPELWAPPVSFTGACAIPFGYAVAHTHGSENWISIFDWNLHPTLHYRCQFVKDIHSIVWFIDSLYVVSTGNNAIYRLIIERDNVMDETLFLALDGDGHQIDAPIDSDILHMNGISEHKGRLVACMLGIKEEDTWSTARKGRVVYVDNPDEIIMDNLYQPHSVQSLNDEIVVCESRTGTLKFEHGREIWIGGFIRGLAWDKNWFYVGVSSIRLKSKSTGIKNADHDGSLENLFTGIVTVSRQMGDVASMRSLRMFGSEIFDVLFVKEATGESMLTDNHLLRNLELEILAGRAIS